MRLKLAILSVFFFAPMNLSEALRFGFSVVAQGYAAS